MMKTSRGVIVFCLLTALSVSCEPEFTELNDLKDLTRKKRDYFVETTGCEGLEVQVGETKGRARISWRNVSEEQVRAGVALALNRNEDDWGIPLMSKHIVGASGSFETTVPLNEGLQLRLHRAGSSSDLSEPLGEEICRGKEYKSPEPVSIRNDTKLQLFVKDGYACFRLFQPQTYIGAYHFEHTFYYSWVGLYENSLASTTDYLSWQWQWVTGFKKGQVLNYEGETFESCTGTKATQGLQARFMWKDYTEWAKTAVL